MVFGGIGVAAVVAVGAVLFAFRDVATPVGEEAIRVTAVTGGGAPGESRLWMCGAEPTTCHQKSMAVTNNPL